MVGILTKTIIPTPVVRWILHARIRGLDYNDVVLVGDDFIQVKEVREHGHLEHVATKSNFDARIRAARILTIDSLDHNDDILMKIENGNSEQIDQHSAPQCLVLTLSSSELVFLCLKEDVQGRYYFVHQSAPLPRFDRLLLQPGEHLAVDPSARALAVAANEREIVLYSTRPGKDISQRLRVESSKWSPIATQRPLQVDGVILHMDFLIPPVDDEDHVLLLLIIADQRRIRAVWIEWHIGSDLHQAHIHPGQPLDTRGGLPTLLIPLRNAAFFLISGFNVTRWTNILSGPLVGTDIPLLQTEAVNPGASPRKPMWANWCRPRRVQNRIDDTDHLYLVREDGVVYLIQAGVDVLSCHAGDFGCNVGTAFASLGDLRDPDILIAAGEMSTGRIYSIGHWSTPIRVSDMDRRDTMMMELVETIPDWASVTDMVLAALPGKSERTRDGIFVTSGRQPYGAVTELRRGLEARLSVYFELDGLRGVTDVWALPLVSVGRVLVILTTPLGTRLLDVSSDAVMQTIEDVEESAIALDAGAQTLAAAIMPDNRLVQVTRRGISVSPGLSPSFEDVSKMECVGSEILAASIEVERGLVVTAERFTSGPSAFMLVPFAIGNFDEDAMDVAQLGRKTSLGTSEEPLCLTTITYSANTLVVAATASGNLQAFVLQQDWTLQLRCERQITGTSHTQSLCDSMVILQYTDAREDSTTSSLLICGLRDGRIYCVHIDLTQDVQFGTDRFIEFSQSKVKLTQPSENTSIAYATSGLDTCLISWDGLNSASIQIQNIHISDKLRPEVSQGSVVACTYMPAAHLLASPDLAESLVLISGDEFLVTVLDRTPAIVPRQLPVSGTPSRLIYAEEQRCFVCASMRYDVQYFPSSIPNSKPEERRQISPVIDFIPARENEPSFSYDMQPGERVYALLEWSYKMGDDKTYSFILLGGSYIKSSGSLRGRITFLQPLNKNWTVKGVKGRKTTSFDAPVYALTLLDSITYAACVGMTVIVSRFSVNDRKWTQICAPFQLGSPGVSMTAKDDTLVICTSADSLVVLRFQQIDDNTDMVGATDQTFRYGLSYVSSGPRADALISQVDLPNIPANMASTTDGRVIGMDSNNSANGLSTSIFFEASLSRSLTRLRRCNIRPRWKDQPSCVLQKDSIIGCAPDGALVGIALIDDHTWERLSWLQRLCEWSEEISPHSYHSPPYAVSEQTYARNERALRAGLGKRTREPSEIIMRTSRSKAEDKHIDGDILQRLLDGDGRGTLKGIIRQTAQKDDRVGEWMRRHLDEELEVVDDMIILLESLLDSWI